MDFPSDSEEQYDETLARDDEDPETDPEEDPEEVPEADPEEDTVLTDTLMRPQVVRDFPSTPPGSPIAVEDSDEMIPDDADTEIAEDSDEAMSDDADTEVTPESVPETPLPPLIPMMPVIEHDLIIAGMTADLAVAYARVDELRMQMAEERRMRLHTRRGGRDRVLRRVMISTLRIERRAVSRLRALRRSHGRVRTRDAERVIGRAMERVRDAARSLDG